MSDETPFRIGLRSARELATPAILLIFGGTLLVTGYHHVPAVTRALATVAVFRAEAGVFFPPVATMLLAGLAPWLFRLATPALRPAHPGRDLLFGLVWWAIMGTVIDAFYRLLGVIFDGRGWPFAATVAAKVLCDMLLFTPALAAPANAISHLWKDVGFDSDAIRASLGAGWYRRLVLPNLIPNFMLWFPGVTLVYSMPSALQLPMSNLIGCFWALMCARIAANSRGRVSVTPLDVA